MKSLSTSEKKETMASSSSSRSPADQTTRTDGEEEKDKPHPYHDDDDDDDKQRAFEKRQKVDSAAAAAAAAEAAPPPPPAQKGSEKEEELLDNEAEKKPQALQQVQDEDDDTTSKDNMDEDRAMVEAKKRAYDGHGAAVGVGLPVSREHSQEMEEFSAPATTKPAAASTGAGETSAVPTTPRINSSSEMEHNKHEHAFENSGNTVTVAVGIPALSQPGAYAYAREGLVERLEPMPLASKNNDHQSGSAATSRDINNGSCSVMDDSSASATGVVSLADSRCLPGTHTAATAAAGTTTTTMESSNDELGLLEAQPVDDTENDRKDLPVANLESQESMEHAQQRRESRQRQRRQFYFGVGLLLVFAAVIIVGIVVGITSHPNNDNASQPVPASNVPPGGANSVSPSSAPSSLEDLRLMELFEDLPNSTRESIRNPSTPQYQAWEWLKKHPGITTLPKWKMQQLFALVTFYHAFEGPQWPQLIDKRWLDYNQDECYWFSGEFGYFDEETGQYIEVNSYGVEPCNPLGEYQQLKMANLQLAGLAPTVPPEVALLTSLSHFSVSLNDTEGPLTNMLPTELSQLTNLTLLNVRTNQLTGTIPTELALLTSLQRLFIWETLVTGPVPSEMGLMTNMTEIELGWNSLSGRLPTEMGFMTNMESIYFSSNAMPGSLPSQIGMLTNLFALYLEENFFTGAVPSELGLLTGLKGFQLSNNSFTGIIPSQLGLLSDSQQMDLTNNNFTGTLPLELCPWDCRERISPFPVGGLLGIETAVSADGCPCVAGATYPSPNSTYEVVASVLYDSWAEETGLGFERFDFDNQTWVALLSETGSTNVSNTLVSYPISLTANTLYHFFSTDIWGDGALILWVAEYLAVDIFGFLHYLYCVLSCVRYLLWWRSLGHQWYSAR